ncbi:MAG TPA: ATP-binding cassette domain-containing protein [Actinoplanes sp.]|nr:ATP-binding cassette domain-containing protein [Actinoplanes sp.]
MIETHELTKHFKSKKATVKAVDGIDLTVAPGELVALLGPNGAGKSTTLRMLTTLIPPTSGTARVAGFDVVRQQREVRHRIGYIGQGNGAGHSQRGRDELMSQGRSYGMRVRDARRRAAELIDSLGLGEVADRTVSTLSGGQRRRLDIAMGLIHAPELLFLDEPSTGLDPQNRANLHEHIVELRKSHETTIVLTTHYLDEADSMAERVIAGRVSAFLMFAVDCVQDLRDGRGLDVEYDRDIWRIGKLGLDFGPSNTYVRSHLRFDRILQRWLRDLAKRWARLRLNGGVGIGRVTSDVGAVTRFSEYLTSSEPCVKRMKDIDRAVIERYLAWLTSQVVGRQVHAVHVDGLRLFLHGVRRYGWDELHTTAVFYPNDNPKRADAKLPRNLAEHVMAQVEQPHNLDRWPTPAGRLVTMILIRRSLSTRRSRRRSAPSRGGCWSGGRTPIGTCSQGTTGTSMDAGRWFLPAIEACCGSGSPRSRYATSMGGRSTSRHTSGGTPSRLG